MQDVIPMLDYEDGPAALDWLARAFGFQEVTRFLAPDGSLSHGEMMAGNGLIMFATATPDYESPEASPGALRACACVVGRSVGDRRRPGVCR